MSDPFSPAESSDLFPSDRIPDRTDPLIPMINIVFLMLTFFMIAGTFQAMEILNIDPPEVASEGKVSEQGALILVDRDGVMALGDEELGLDAIVTRLKQLAADSPVEVRLKADRATRAHVILPLLKALSDNGINKVQLIAVGQNAGR